MTAFPQGQGTFETHGIFQLCCPFLGVEKPGPSRDPHSKIKDSQTRSQYPKGSGSFPSVLAQFALSKNSAAFFSVSLQTLSRDPNPTGDPVSQGKLLQFPCTNRNLALMRIWGRCGKAGKDEVMAALTCNPGCVGGRDQGDHGSRPAPGKGFAERHLN
jgi:hypothetical protein